MSETVACPHCNAGLLFRPEFANRIVICPRCKQQVQMPDVVQPQVLEAELAPTVTTATPTSGFPGVNTGSTSNGSASYRKKPDGLPKWLQIALALGACFVMCSGLLNTLIGVKPNGENASPKLGRSKYAPTPAMTADFLPFKAGAEVDLRWSGDDFVQFRSRYVFKDENTCILMNPEIWHEGTDAYHKRTGERWMLHKKAAPGAGSEIKRLVKDGFVLIVDDAGQTHAPIKLGAVPGDRWSYEVSGLRRNYTYSQYKEWDDYLTGQPTYVAIVDEKEHRLGRLVAERYWRLIPHLGVDAIGESDPTGKSKDKLKWTTPRLLSERNPAQQAYFD